MSDDNSNGHAEGCLRWTFGLVCGGCVLIVLLAWIQHGRCEKRRIGTAKPTECYKDMLRKISEKIHTSSDSLLLQNYKDTITLNANLLQNELEGDWSCSCDYIDKHTKEIGRLAPVIDSLYRKQPSSFEAEPPPPPPPHKKIGHPFTASIKFEPSKKSVESMDKACTNLKYGSFDVCEFTCKVGYKPLGTVLPKGTLFYSLTDEHRNCVLIAGRIDSVNVIYSGSQPLGINHKFKIVAKDLFDKGLLGQVLNIEVIAMLDSEEKLPIYLNVDRKRIKFINPESTQNKTH